MRCSKFLDIMKKAMTSFVPDVIRSFFFFIFFSKNSDETNSNVVPVYSFETTIMHFVYVST